ncbi:LacI family transcriptional regulator [Psychromonas sp. RZ22]|uniref:LacI family DNA-binding transcriptional regulator n=1 Tax=Psychromonas algarum TaxID=2555643 RepID=UPI001067E315|nr:LacI family DNA-binding transcriptional regulator [Psychromonas sp. RZ22]TEW56835.1 LacI family transcriptional regulator [Psychromonas sp. RZ22]
MTKIRIIDVATRASVSKSTVSQYLNGRFGHMSATTKEKIRLAVEELNYVPNPIARSLKSDKTKTIGVIVRDIAGFNISRVLRGIDDFCKENDYNVLIYNTDFNEEIERRSLITLKQMCVDGIIITSTGKNNDLINDYVKSGFPLVQFQLEYQDCHTNIVLSDYRQAAQKATEHLIKLGHKRICFLTQEFAGNLSRTERYQGYMDALKAHDIEFEESFIQYWKRDSSFIQSPISLLQTTNAPTAFFTQHLAITTDLLKQLNQHQFNIPNDVSIVGFDEIPMVEMFKVPITVIQQNSYNLGTESAKLLLSILTDKITPSEIKKIIVPCSLVVRESCKNIQS